MKLRPFEIVPYKKARELLTKSKNIFNISTKEEVFLDETAEYTICLYKNKFIFKEHSFPSFMNEDVEIFLTRKGEKCMQLFGWTDELKYFIFQ